MKKNTKKSNVDEDLIEQFRASLEDLKNGRIRRVV